MKQLCVLLAVAVTAMLILAQTNAHQPLAGRWDLTIKTPTDTYPSWMEFSEANGSPDVRIVGRVASVHPATALKLSGSHMSFSSSEYFGKEITVTWEMSVTNGKLSGTQKREDGVEGRITGVRAPALDREPPNNWRTPETLFKEKI
jgi:hypothetical protein